jgi:Protein of unknown function (DUF3126)
VTREETTTLEKYLRRCLGSADLKLKPVPKKGDMLEAYRGDEFLGLVYKIEEDGELSYEFRMAILDIDLAP